MVKEVSCKNNFFEGFWEGLFKESGGRKDVEFGGEENAKQVDSRKIEGWGDRWNKSEDEGEGKRSGKRLGWGEGGERVEKRGEEREREGGRE
jgi:hypothetical protein